MRLKIKWALQQFDEHMDEYATAALNVTKAVKRALESPLVDVLESIIPGDADTMLKNKILQALETGIHALSIVQTCQQQATVEAKLLCFVTELRKTSPALQEAVLQKLQSILLRELDGNTKKQHLYDLFSQAKYSSVK